MISLSTRRQFCYSSPVRFTWYKYDFLHGELNNECPFHTGKRRLQKDQTATAPPKGKSGSKDLPKGKPLPRIGQMLSDLETTKPKRTVRTSAAAAAGKKKGVCIESVS